MQGTPVASMELRAELGARLQMQAEAQEVALDEDQGAATAIELIVARNDALAGEAAAASRLAVPLSRLRAGWSEPERIS